MKAAVLRSSGGIPAYEDFADPVQQNDDQLLINVKAASVKNLDKSRAAGTHYASYKTFPVVVGIDGVGTLQDGTRIYAQGLDGMIAEKALITKNKYVVLPPAIDDATAAALPNAIMGAALALLFRAELKPGDHVLINGATGVTGQIAVQVAKFYGAAKIIVTGRNADSLQKLLTLGADETISLKQDDSGVLDQLKKNHEASPINIVIDYLWGWPAELIITALKGGGLHAAYHKIKFVTVGSMAGENIQLSSGTLRSSAVEISGSGIGSLPPEAMQKFSTEVVPQMFRLAADGKLFIETETAALKDVADVWDKEMPPGKRLVIMM